MRFGSSSSNSWQEILKNPKTPSHLVQLYQQETFLVESVSVFIRHSLERNEGVILVINPAHWETIRFYLENDGIPVERFQNEGQLTVLDAEKILAQFLVDQFPDWKLFQAVMGKILQKAQAKYPAIRIYGEMVNVLWQEGNAEAALYLEGLWNELLKTHFFTLFCAYCMDILDHDIQQSFVQNICQTHIEVIPSPDYARFEKAILKAIQTALSPPHAGMLRKLTAQRHLDQTPALSMLYWLHQNMPRTAQKVLSLSRLYLENVPGFPAPPTSS